MINHKHNIINNNDQVFQKASSLSKFLSELLQSKPFFKNTLNKNLRSKIKKAHLNSFITNRSINNLEELNKALREMREKFFALSLLRDVNNLCDLSEVFDTHTNLADIALQIAYKYHNKELIKRYGKPQNFNGVTKHLIIVGMGKLGGKELNPSSDIDLIFLYEEDGVTTKNKSNAEFFTELSKRIISSLNDYTEDGIVFRVDTRLRPFGSHGLIAIPLDALENYLSLNGLDWERYAWLKARVIIGPEMELNTIINPFIYRKYLDFNIFSSLRSIKEKINNEMIKKINEGDIKLGKGGIRTIEFIVQSYQLVWGGKDKSIRSKNFLIALESLFIKKLIDKPLYNLLFSAYHFFRNLEHRLQYVNDQQTHKIPNEKNSQLQIAYSMNEDKWDDLKLKISTYQDSIEEVFRDLFNKEKNQSIITKDKFETIWHLDCSEKSATDFLASIGYEKPIDTYKFLKNTMTMGSFNSLPLSTQEKMNGLIPLVIKEVANTDNPDRTIVVIVNALDIISKRSSYLSLLKENQSTLILLIKIASFSEDIIERMTQYPVMIDDLIDTSRFIKPFNMHESKFILCEQLELNDRNIEEQMDLLRKFKSSMFMKLAVQEKMKIYSIEKISDALADIADFIVEKSLFCIWKSLYPKASFPEVGIIAYGKFGGKELSYLSDLDIVFVYKDTKNIVRDRLIKLAQRFNSWMTLKTMSGSLYDIDLRLRPDGGSGLLVSSWDTFNDYQLNKSLTWEHQSLTRARFVSKNNGLKIKFIKLRELILLKNRDIKLLKIDIKNMRERIYENKKPKGDLFDLKHSRGGLIDIEFLTQFYILGFSHKYKDLLENVGNIALLEKIAFLDLMNKEQANQLIASFRCYRQKQHQQGLNPKNPGKVRKLSVLEHSKNVKKIWDKTFN